MDDKQQIYRVIDANLNRLREGLRVCEEYFRFVKNEATQAKFLKNLRHKCKNLQDSFDANALLSNRNSAEDPFSSGLEANEGERETCDDLLKANIKRSQEAARVIEEFAKILQTETAPQIAKNIRFELYTFEKEIYCGNHI